MALLNLEKIQELRDLDESIVGELIDLYFTNAPQSYQKLIAAYNAQDSDTLNFESHSLKSSSRNLGCDDLGEICAQIEEISKAKGLPDSALMDRFKQSFDAAIEALKKLRNS